MLDELNPWISDKDVTEKALQRAIYRSEDCIKGKGTHIQWLDIELPVISDGPPRRDSLDMIGKYLNGQNKGKFIICEAKFCSDTSKSDNPENAVEELSRYISHIGDGAALEAAECHHGAATFDWRDVPKKCEKWFLANSAYWAYWLGHMDQWQFRDDIYYCYVDVPGDCFKDQALSQSKYIPRMPKDITTIHTIRPIKSK